MPPYLPVQAVSRSQNIRIGKPGVQVPQAGSASANVYVDLADGNQRRDLQRHMAIGALIVTGSLTQSSVDPVVTDGALVTSSGTGNATVNLSAGTLKNRSTAASVDVPAASQVIAACPTNTRIDIIAVNSTTGALVYIQGVAAVTPAAPAVPAVDTPIAQIAVPNAFTGTSTVAAGSITDIRPRP